MRMHVVVVRLGVVPGRLRRRPSCAIRPSCTTTARPISGRSGPSSCSTSRIVPPLPANRVSAAANASWLAASTPAFGSSSTSRSGLPARARAIRVRCCWPPERVATGSSIRSSRPTSVSASRTAALSAAPGSRKMPRRASRPDATTSPTVAGTPLPAPRRCGTYPIRAHCRNRRCGVPNSSISPRSSGTSPSTVRIRVDLPDPLAPRIATTSPAATLSDTSRRISRPSYPAAPCRTSTTVMRCTPGPW